ncbi:MAG: transposase [Candidatus Lutacidiplasmatales archaeon]
MGEIIAVPLVAYVSPIERFENTNKVTAYHGLRPTTHQSGDSSYQGHLHQDADHVLRWILIEAGWRTPHLEKRSDVAKADNRFARRRGKSTRSIAAAH